MELNPPLARLTGYELRGLIAHLVDQRAEFPERPPLQALRPAARATLGWDHARGDAFSDPMFSTLYEALRARLIQLSSSFAPEWDVVLQLLGDLLEGIRENEAGAE